MPVIPLRLGDRGPAVADIRRVLHEQGLLIESDNTVRSLWPRKKKNSKAHVPADEYFDETLDRAVRAFQQSRGLLVDGCIGPATFCALTDIKFQALGSRLLSFHSKKPLTGDDVAALQSRLQELGFYISIIDGIFGPDTDSAVRDYQKDFGLIADGIVGNETLRSLRFLGLGITGGSAHALKEVELVRDSGPRLAGKCVILDPGLGGSQLGTIISTPEGPFSEADLLWDTAARVAKKLSAAGVQVVFSRAEKEFVSDSDKAKVANDHKADLMISLRFAHYANKTAQGVASFYYGNTHGSFSTIGKQLASYIQREIVTRTKMNDCRFHECTLELLRLTKMPTVQIDLGYISNPHDVTMIGKGSCRDKIADAIVVAIKRLYLLGKNEQPTGTYTFADLIADESISQA